MVFTNLGILDFGGPQRQARLCAVHPGITPAEVQNATGFELVIAGEIPETAEPTDHQLALLKRLDPHNLRASVLA
jgi:glutaconate CoA-transferase subunit B